MYSTPFFLVALLIAAPLSAQEWTRFRGPNGNGNSEARIPATWSQDDYNWHVDLPGIGHSSPVIWGKRLFIQSADPDDGTQYMLCLDTASGKAIWKKEIKSKPYHIHARNSLASCTPTVDKDAVYFAWATPDEIHLSAWTHDGEQIWARDDLGPYASQHGFGSSPMIAGELIILPNLQMPSRQLGKETSAVWAFNKRNGEIVWTTPRTSGKASYSVPCLRTNSSGNQELVLCSTTHGMFGLDLKTGKENWAVQDAFSMRTVSSPVLVGDIVFGSTGSGAGGNYVAAIDMNEAEVRYEVKRQAPYVPTPVAFGELVFLWYDKGVITCIDASTGKQHWTTRIGGNYSGSPVCVDGKVYCIAEDGTVVVIAATDEFELLGKTSLGEDSRSTPAVAGGAMYLRTYSKLYSIGG